MAPLFQLEGLGDDSKLSHSIEANSCHLPHQSCLLTKQPFLHSRYICLGVLQQIALLGQNYFISFTISLRQSRLFKTQPCRFIKVCGVKLQSSVYLHKCKKTRHALLTLQNNYRDNSFQLSCALGEGNVFLGLQRFAFCYDSFPGLKDSNGAVATHRAVYTQPLGRMYTEDLTQHHQHLCGHSSCGRVAAAGTMATLLAAETNQSYPYMPRVGLHRLDTHIAVCGRQRADLSPQKIKALLTASSSC